MKRLLVFLLLSLSLIQNTSAAVTPGDNEDLLRAVDRFIIPETIHLEQAMIMLAEHTDAYCEAPGEATLVQLKQDFHYGMNAWQSIQVIRFGPMEYAMRAYRFQMWPDKRTKVSQHLSSLLASEDAEALKPENFARGSVAVQGLSAMERLLFNDQPISPYECAVLQAIAHNLASMSSNLIRDWMMEDEPHRMFILTSPEGNALYESDMEVRSKLLNNLHTELQLIVEQKLQEPLSNSIETAKPKRTESWRSQRSLRNIGINLKAVERLYKITFLPQLDDSVLAQRIEQAFNDSYTRLRDIDMPLNQAITDANQRPAVEQLMQTINQLRLLFANELPQALGVPLGFNSLDGD